MLKVKEIRKDTINNAGCSNGNYTPVTLHIHDDDKELLWIGKTCRCGYGCSNTWRTGTIDYKGDWIPITAESFRDEAQLDEYLTS